MNPVIPLLALGGLAALALGAKNKRSASAPMLPPFVPPPVSEPPPAPFEPPPELPAPEPPPPHPRPHGKREKPPAAPAPAPAPAPSAPPVAAPAPAPASPPQTLPELAKKADEIFNAPSPPPPVATPPLPPLIPPPPAASSAPGTVTPPPTPVAVPGAPTGAPAGFDPVKARRIAPRIASHLKTKGIANYSRQALREFQVLAGINADGIYGGQTAGALRYYLGGAKPPAAMFKPVQEVPYTPPGS